MCLMTQNTAVSCSYHIWWGYDIKGAFENLKVVN